MSDSDSFIDEVTEEVRRDRFYGYLRRYGWIAVLLVVLIVGGAAWNEYRKAQNAARAEALGDAILEAYRDDDQVTRAQALAALTSDDPTARAALDLIVASELARAEDTVEAAERLNALALNPDVPEIYRQLAGFKALLVQSGDLDTATRSAGFQGFAVPGNPMRMLAEEQLGLIEVETGNVTGAIDRFQTILNDAEASSDLQQRAMQVIVSLGGEPDSPALPEAQNN